MKVIESGKFTADRAWGALDICVMNGTSCRLHWTDTPYKWHVNDGELCTLALGEMARVRNRREGLR